MNIFCCSSQTAPGETITIVDYAANMKAGQRDIYYLAAPSRQLAENSPYYEALKVRFHSSEIRSLCLMKCPSETLQNLSYFISR